MASLLQPSMTGGELSPSLHSRVDLARYLTSLKTCRNFIVQQYGGVTNRAGTRFIREVKNSAYFHRLVPFEFSTVQTYVLEFGHLTMRVIRNGGYVESSPGVIYEVATPYSSHNLRSLSNLDLINWTQSADVLTVVHPSYHPRQFGRTGHAAWTVSLFPNKNGPFQDINVNAGVVVSASGTSGSITLTANSGIFTAALVGTQFYLEDDHLDAVKPWGPGQPNLTVGTLRRSDGKVYQLTAVPGTSGTKGHRAGGVRPTHDEGEAWDGDESIESSGNYAEGYRWKYQHAGFGVVQITGFTSATSVSATVLQTLPASVVSQGTHKWAKAAWSSEQGYPSAVTYFQNRQVFGGTAAQPQRSWMSRIGDYVDFGVSRPIQADDAIDFPIPGRQVNAVRHLVPLKDLAVFTSGSEWTLSGGQNKIIAPDTISVGNEGYRGSARVPPVIIGSTALYLQDKGRVVREFAFDFATDRYDGRDLTQLASHLFGSPIVDWAFQQVPFQTVWCVREDGVLLGLTYLKDQEVVGWHRHDTDGQFESVACISEGGEDALYCVVKRAVNGATKRYVERMNTRMFSDARDWFFVDSGLTYDGRNKETTTVTITTSTDWTHKASEFTLTASSALFAAGDVGAEVHFPIGSQVIRMAITGFTSATVVTATANRDVPDALRGAATTGWGMARKVFSGLGHLEGKACNVLADGNVHPQRTVSTGSIELQYAAVVVHVGLPITADVETLGITIQNQETILDKKKLITALRLMVENTRGLEVGPDPDHLLEIKQRSTENYDEPTAATTGMMETAIPAAWSKDGRCFIRQSDPLPATILGIIPDAIVGGP